MDAGLLPSNRSTIGMMKTFISFILAAAVSVPATAQVVVQAASAHLQPQIGRDSKGYNVCGIRAVVLDEKPSSVEAYDFSVNIRAELFGGLIKAGKSTIPKKDFLNGKMTSKVVIPGPVSFWISKESDGNALIPPKFIPGETPGFILGGGELTAAWRLVLAIMHGERIQFAVRYKNQGFDTVMSFSGKLKDEELMPLSACLDGLLARLQAEEPAPANK